MGKDEQVSAILVGSIKPNNKKNAKSYSSFLTSRQQSYSKLLIGQLKDTDKDKVPDRFDCNYLNPKEHGVIDNIKRIFTKPKPAPAPPKQSSSSNPVKDLLNSGGSKVIAPTRGNVQSILDSGGSKVISGGSSSSSRTYYGGGGSSSSSSQAQQQLIQQLETPQQTAQRQKVEKILSPQQQGIQKYKEQTNNQQQDYQKYGGIGVVSATSQDLSRKNSSKNNENHNGLPWNDNRVDSEQQPNTSWFSRIFGSSKDFKEGFQKQTYSPTLGGFVSASEQSGQATAIITPETIEQKKTREFKSDVSNVIKRTPDFKVDINKDQPQNTVFSPPPLITAPAERVVGLKERKIKEKFDKFTGRDKTKEQKYNLFPFLLGTDETLTPEEEYKKGDKFSLRYFHVWMGTQLSKKINKPDFNVVTIRDTKIKPSKTGHGSTGIITPLSTQEKEEEYKGQTKALKIMQNVVAEIPTYTFFSPFMGTGTAQQSKYVYDHERGRFLTKEEAQEYADAVLRKFDDAYKSGGGDGVKKELSNMLKDAKNTQGVENFLSILRDKGYIKDFVFDTGTGKFAINTLSGEVIQPSGDIISKIPAMKNIEIAASASNLLYTTPQKEESEYAGTGMHEKTDSVAYDKVKQKDLNIERLSTPMLDRMKTKDRQITGIIQRSDTNTIQRNMSAQISGLLNQQKTNQKPKSKQLETLSFNQPQIEKQKETPDYPMPQMMVVSFPGEQTPPRTPRTPHQSKIILPFFRRKSQKKKPKYQAEVRRYGIFQPVSKPTSLSEAVSKGVGNVRRSLGASFRVREVGGKGGLVMLKSSPEFRVSQKEKGVVIQKRKYRLSSRGEKGEIKEAKRRKRFRL